MIKAYDTQKVGGNMLNALVEQEAARKRSAREARLEAENEWLKMCREMDRKRIDRLMRERMNRMPVNRQRGNALSDAWWALVGWTVLGFGSLIERISV